MLRFGGETAHALGIRRLLCAPQQSNRTKNSSVYPPQPHRERRWAVGAARRVGLRLLFVIRRENRGAIPAAWASPFEGLLRCRRIVLVDRCGALLPKGHGWCVPPSHPPAGLRCGVVVPVGS